jgi:hypothetical protein
MNPMQATESGRVPKGWSTCSLVSPVATPMVEPDFLPMQAVALGETKGEAINQNTITIEIGKCRISVPVGADSEMLTAVCRTLLSLC